MNFMKRAVPVAALALAGWWFRSRSRSEGQAGYVKGVFRPIGAWAARRALVGRNRSRRAPQLGRFTRADVGRLLVDAWRRYDAQAPHLPVQPTVGSRMNIKLACLTTSLFQALLEDGVERAYAVELAADVTWKVYEQWGRLAQLRSRMRPPTEAALAARVRPDGTVALAFPFNAPGYIARHVPNQQGLAFHMIRCAVADYFRSQGAIDLCLAAWCNLDYPLGQMGGLTLRRTRTLVEGADDCDFHWTIANSAQKIGGAKPLPHPLQPQPGPRRASQHSARGTA
jgi:hypothetical protein